MDIYIDDQHVGALIIRERSSTFIYANEWQKNGFSIAPNLPITIKEHHVAGVHGIFTDAAPDRWGRKLIERKYEGAYVSEQDYLLGVSDRLRLGALRFSLDGGKTFEGKGDIIPPLTSLPKFKQLCDAMMRGEEHDYSELISNASLGGARAKIVVDDHDTQYIAKVPQIYDQGDVEGWEYVCLKLAHKSGITVPACTLHGDTHNHTLLIERFDRNASGRIHYMSAMTLMGLKDGESSTYIDLAYEISERIGTQCLHELYRRMLLNILVSNTDDHLRNHGFLYQDGWVLSPAFDITISKRAYGSNHALRINGEDRDDFDTAINMCEYFNLNQEQAASILSDVIKAAKQWKPIAASAGIRAASKVSGNIFLEEAIDCKKRV